VFVWPPVAYLASMGSPKSFNQGLGGYNLETVVRRRLGLEDFCGDKVRWAVLDVKPTKRNWV